MERYTYRCRTEVGAEVLREVLVYDHPQVQARMINRRERSVDVGPLSQFPFERIVTEDQVQSGEATDPNNILIERTGLRVCLFTGHFYRSDEQWFTGDEELERYIQTQLHETIVSRDLQSEAFDYPIMEVNGSMILDGRSVVASRYSAEWERYMCFIRHWINDADEPQSASYVLAHPHFERFDVIGPTELVREFRSRRATIDGWLCVEMPAIFSDVRRYAAFYRPDDPVLVAWIRGGFLNENHRPIRRNQQ